VYIRPKSLIVGMSKMDNCTINPCGWPKLQITHCGINMNSEIPLVSLIYKSIPRIKFC
jgi:hypothetical protein